MIYDSDQNITWLQDANYSKTSGYDIDGMMNWDEAFVWVRNLDYGGYNDWRLPNILDKGNDSCNYAYSGTDCGYNVDTSTSELAYLWYDILGNIPFCDTFGACGQSGWGLTSTTADGVEFINIQLTNYWTETDYPYFTGSSWLFNSLYGNQGWYPDTYTFGAWAVRDGDVLKIFEPTTSALLSLGLVGLGFSVRKIKNHDKY